MTDKDKKAILKNREDIHSVFGFIEESISFANEAYLDRQMEILKRFKSIQVEVTEDKLLYTKLDRRGKQCNSPALYSNDATFISSYPEFFLFQNLFVLKQHPSFIDKKYLKGTYFRYKDTHFVSLCFSNFTSDIYRITEISPLKTRKPIVIVPYRDTYPHKPERNGHQ